jgi:hypothetical protein
VAITFYHIKTSSFRGPKGLTAWRGTQKEPHSISKSVIGLDLVPIGEESRTKRTFKPPAPANSASRGSFLNICSACQDFLIETIEGRREW